MRLFASAAVLATLLATSAVAQTPSDPPASETKQEAKKDAKKDDGVICRREIPTGSLFAVKVCTTAEQRKAQSSATRNAQGAMQSAAPQLPQ
jgi:hypothetical protein